MAPLLEDDLLPGAGVDADGDLVALRPRGNEDRGLHPEALGDACLEPAHGWVLAVDVVAHLGLGHRAAHARRRAGDGVGAEVDRGVGHGEVRTTTGAWLARRCPSDGRAR